MQVRERRTLSYLVLVVLTTAGFTIVYNLGMAGWESQSQPLTHSLEVVVQSFTTTGYGEDAPWQTPQMHFMVIAMQFAGIGLILTAADLFAVPWLRDVLTPAAPTAVTDREGHVVICSYTPRTEAFIAELENRDRAYVLVESDANLARTLYQDDVTVIRGDPEVPETLENAEIESARALVTDAADDTSASIVLGARELAPDCRLLTLVEDVDLVPYHRAAGADDVLSPRQLLGESLAREVPTAVTSTVEEGVALGEDFELVEFTVDEDSNFLDRSVTDAELRARYGVDVLGAWFDGTFESPVDPETELSAGSRLLVVGETHRIDELREALTSTVRGITTQDIILAGYGDSGKAVHEALSRTTAILTVLDIEDSDVVDVVGDARDPDVLEEAGVGTAATLVLTVADDTTAIFTTLIARRANPNLQIVVRANHEENVQKLYQAGADYVLSLATVSGRMLVSELFEEEEVLAFDKQISVVRLPAEGLAGTTLADAAVRSETGSTVVAIVRDEKTITEFDPASFTFEADDEVVIAGTDEAVAEFELEFSS